MNLHMYRGCLNLDVIARQCEDWKDMSRPQDRLLEEMTFHSWSKLEIVCRRCIPSRLRSLVDVSQIVNDGLLEWHAVLTSNAAQPDDDIIDCAQAMAILVDILRKRSIDCVRKLNAWKRGGRNLTLDESAFEWSATSKCVCHECEVESDDTYARLRSCLKLDQQRILDLRLNGCLESEIAEQLMMSISNVQQSRREIKSIANELFSDTTQPRTTKNQEK